MTPNNLTQFNILGGPGFVADATPATNTCEIGVTVNCTEPGVNVELIIDDSATGITAPCQAQGGLTPPFLGVATFNSVSLTSKNDSDDFTTLSARQTVPGVPDGNAPSISVQADCEAPACSITGPNLGLDYLNIAADEVAGAPLQTTFTVQSDLLSDGDPVRITFNADDDTTLTSTFDSVGEGTFAGITLADGLYSVEAECFDAAGNSTTSVPETWTVDTLACSSTLVVAGGADPITPGDPPDGVPGIQVLATGQPAEGDCTGARAGVCGALPATFTTLAPGASFSLALTLPEVNGTADVCLELEDAAGNPSDRELTVNTRISAPALQISAPADDTRFNRTGAGGATVDLQLGSSTCEANIVVDCTDVGVGVELLVNGGVAATANCAAQGGLTPPFLGRASFSSFSLATENDGSETTLAARQTVPGLPVGTAAAIGVRADCEVPSCSITFPDGNLAFLNADDDNLPAIPDLQETFTVAGDTASIGAVTLIVDSVSSTPVTTVSGVASFVDVTLIEGDRTVTAQCSDSAGNVATAAPEIWTVDTIPCSSSFDVAGGADPIIPADDLDPPPTGEADFQLLADGSASGGDCVGALVGAGDCSTVSGSFSPLGAGASFALDLTLASTTGPAAVCVKVLDLAGNVGEDPALVNVRVDPPVLEFTSPTDGDSFNASSVGGCTQDVTVNCSDEDEGADDDVTLSVDGVLTATLPCTGGTVTFQDVVLPEHDDNETAELSVQQIGDDLTSLPEIIEVQADCNVPAPSITSPVCGSFLGLATHDVAPGTPDLQVNVTAATDGGGLDPTLTVTRSGVGTDSPGTGDETSATFSAVNLGSTGSIQLSACVTDIHGNEGCSLPSACALTIALEPTISITTPTNGTSFNAAAVDCDANTGGLQITVSGTSTAVNGSDVSVTVGAGATGTGTVTAGAWTACATALEGDDQDVVAEVTDATTDLQGDTTGQVVQVSVDATPIGSIASPTITFTHRRATAYTLNWLSISDAEGDALVSYHLRCAATDITSQANWDAATPVTVVPAAAAGVTQTHTLTGIKTGMAARFCVVRGEDDLGNLSPIAPFLSAVVSNQFLEQPYTIVDSGDNQTALSRVSVDPVGDVNGDGVADFVTGATNQKAQLFFGKTTLDDDVSETPGVEFTFGGFTPNSVGFGSEVAGLGDITGDGISDFAFGVPGANAVFVFFGRSTAWPATTIDVDTSSADGCEADLCIVGSALNGAAAAFFGWDIHSANFDDTGPNDLVIGARFASTTGQVFILLGGTQLATSGTTITVVNSNPTVNNTVKGYIVTGPAANTGFGFSVGSLGTNFRDVLIGANGVAGTGANFYLPSQGVPAGNGLTPLSAQLVTVDTGTAANFGNSIRGVGDYNGDTLGDFVAGENFQSLGFVTMYLGRADGTFSSTTTQLAFTNNAGFDDNYGTFIGAGLRPGLGLVGDLDNDGFSELLIGATIPEGSPVGSRGSAQLFYGAVGAVARLRSAADFSHTSTLASGQVIPNFIGDLNDDGFNDIVMLDGAATVGAVNTLRLLY